MDSSQPQVFANPNLLWTSLVWLVLFAFTCGVSYVLASLSNRISGLVSLVIGAAICALAEYLTLTQMSDVVIDDEGISRSHFGMTWRIIRWSDLREITAFVPPFGGSRRVFRLYQSLQPRFIRPNTIVIPDDIRDVGPLFERVLNYIRRNDLKVKITVDGQVATADQLVRVAAANEF
jgi:hypothetical protein